MKAHAERLKLSDCAEPSKTIERAGYEAPCTVEEDAARVTSINDP